MSYPHGITAVTIVEDGRVVHRIDCTKAAEQKPQQRRTVKGAAGFVLVESRPDPETIASAEDFDD